METPGFSHGVVCDKSGKAHGFSRGSMSDSVLKSNAKEKGYMHEI